MNKNVSYCCPKCFTTNKDSGVNFIPLCTSAACECHKDFAVGAQVEVRSDLDWEGTTGLRERLEGLAAVNYNLYLGSPAHRKDTGAEWLYKDAVDELLSFIRAEIKAAEERGRAQALAEVRAGVPPEDTTPDANEYERADRIAWNACRTAVLDLLTRLTTPVGE